LERSQTPKGKRARDRILIAAEKLIAERGFYGTSMRDIAGAARLPLATTVYHFAKKEQLYAAILGEIAAALDARLQAAMNERYEHYEHHEHGSARAASVPSTTPPTASPTTLRTASPTTSRTTSPTSSSTRSPTTSPTAPIATAATTAPTTAIDALAVALLRWAAEEPGRVKLLLRELLDNSARVAKATRLPLAGFLERASALVAARGVPQPEVVVLHLVGAISYFVAAWPTVERIVGAPRANQITAAYEREVISLARRMVETSVLDLPAKRRTRARGAA
jgi:AcrR family transcriptional regulator